MPCTVGIYGGSLGGNLRYLNDLIIWELDNNGFKSSFKELWIDLLYPPQNIRKAIIGLYPGFKEAYERPPKTRVSRRYKKIDVALKANEFAIHFASKERYSEGEFITVNSDLKKYSEPQLAIVLIDKYLSIPDLIKKKLRKEDLFPIDLFIKVLKDIRKKINAEYLQTIHNRFEKIDLEKRLKNAIERREKRRAVNLANDRKIRVITAYYNSLPVKALFPYCNQYCDLFLKKLREKNFRCPGYSILYIRISESIETALLESVNYEKWYRNGIAIIDYKKYIDSPEEEKKKIVFRLVANGLRDIAEIDKLDIDVLDEVREMIYKSEFTS